LIPIETLSVFIAASVALALAPGPDNIFVLTQSALHGRIAGLFVTVGLCTGLIVHTAAVALGVAAIFATSALAFTILKTIGAAYLLYLAWQAFRAGTAALSNNQGPALSHRQLYGLGIVMNITNPKVAIFFLAFLPQFADPAHGALPLQIFIFGGLFILATLLVFGGVAWFSGFIGEWLKGSARAQRNLNWLAGTVFIGLAVHLLAQER